MPECQCIAQVNEVTNILCQPLEKVMSCLVPHSPVANEWPEPVIHMYITYIHNHMYM